MRARCLGVFSTRQTWILSGLIIGSSGIQLPSRIHRTRNRAGSEQKGRSRGVREGWKAMARCNWYRWKAGEGGGGEIWFNVPMTLLSEADNRHGRHKGAVVKFQLTKGDPKNRAESSSCNRGSRLFFLLLSIYLFIHSTKEMEVLFSIRRRKKKKTWKEIQENRKYEWNIRKFFSVWCKERICSAWCTSSIIVRRVYQYLQIAWQKSRSQVIMFIRKVTSFWKYRFSIRRK